MIIGGTVNLSFSQQFNVLQQGRPSCCVVGVTQTDPGLSLRRPLVLNVRISDEDVSSGFVDPDKRRS